MHDDIPFQRPAHEYDIGPPGINLLGGVPNTLCLGSERSTEPRILFVLGTLVALAAAPGKEITRDLPRCCLVSTEEVAVGGPDVDFLTIIGANLAGPALATRWLRSSVWLWGGDWFPNSGWPSNRRWGRQLACPLGTSRHAHWQGGLELLSVIAKVTVAYARFWWRQVRGTAASAMCWTRRPARITMAAVH